jgi:hypothetical protein
MSKLTLTWCLAAAVVAGLPRTSSATNYHEYKKFPAEGQSNWNSSLPAHSHSADVTSIRKSVGTNFGTRTDVRTA